MRIAYHELFLAIEGTPHERALIGDPADLPKPWLPDTCTDPELRWQVWEWLEDVAAWINHEHTWDPLTSIPACWPRHPHLAHELPVLADRRRRAGHAVTSDLLEEWHRDTLPAFLSRLRFSLRDLCDDGHQPWPGRNRHTRYLAEDTSHDRHDTITRDAASQMPVTEARRSAHGATRLPDQDHLALLNNRTGEITPHPTGPT